MQKTGHADVIWAKIAYFQCATVDLVERCVESRFIDSFSAPGSKILISAESMTPDLKK